MLLVTSCFGIQSKAPACDEPNGLFNPVDWTQEQPSVYYCGKNRASRWSSLPTNTHEAFSCKMTLVKRQCECASDQITITSRNTHDHTSISMN